MANWTSDRAKSTVWKASLLKIHIEAEPTVGKGWDWNGPRLNSPGSGGLKLLVKTPLARVSMSEVWIGVGSIAQSAAWTEMMEVMAMASVARAGLKYILRIFCCFECF
jgi:hypothetical protein